MSLFSDVFSLHSSQCSLTEGVQPMNGRSQMQGSKKVILPKDMDKCKSVFLRLSFARNLENHLRYVLLWDRMEGAWLWTLFTFCQNRLLVVTSHHSALWSNTPCCVLTEQELSEILVINWQCSNIIQYLNRESWKKYIYLKGIWKMCKRGSFQFSSLKPKST
jgi:hypothetical protein